MRCSLPLPHAPYMVVLTTLLFLLIAHTHAATLYGLSENVQLISIDPTTFNVTAIGKPIPNEIEAQNLASIDAKNGIYYFIGYNPRNSTASLIGLSLKDGSILRSIALPFAEEGFIGVGQYCNVDTTSGDVFVTGPLDDGGPTHVMRINVNVGLAVNVGIIEDFDMGSFSAFDSTAGVLYLQTYDNAGFWIHAMDVKTGEIVSKIKNDETYWMESMNYDPVTMKMYGVGLNRTNAEDSRRTLVSLDQKTGEFTQIAVIPGYWIISDSIASLDVKERRLSCFLSPYNDGDAFNLVSVNIDSGKLLYAPPACKDDAECPWSIEYGL